MDTVSYAGESGSTSNTVLILDQEHNYKLQVN